ncbi:hypothetical protein [Salinibacterium sp. ZJ450]|uniref:hypothetical protein n=1 Tax=Salinibacterium sp. ZJ450 TaxID=2708338 RepID=UPI001422D2A8|nr:hypothetical protein [Salinibacterium sp. ZJ450]
MALGYQNGGFLSRMGGTFGLTDVVVVNKPRTSEETRQNLRSHVQSTKAFFEVDAPVWEGDEIHLPDPRGGTRTIYVTNVKINDVRGARSFNGMSHLVASFSDSAPRPSMSARGSQVFNAPVVMVSGGQANVAWDGGSTNTQNLSPISEGYEDLAKTLTEAIGLLSGANDIDSDERELGEEAAKAALSEITKPEPDRKRIKGALAALRGILTTAANSASGSAAKVLVESLMIS